MNFNGFVHECVERKMLCIQWILFIKYYHEQGRRQIHVSHIYDLLTNFYTINRVSVLIKNIFYSRFLYSYHALKIYLNRIHLKQILLQGTKQLWLPFGKACSKRQNGMKRRLFKYGGLVALEQHTNDRYQCRLHKENSLKCFFQQCCESILLWSDYPGD